MTELRQRDPRVECPAFLAFLRRKPCCACGAPAPSQAAHVRFSDAASGNANPGNAKPHDRHAVPLCAGCHLDDPGAQHRVGERRFWARVGIDPYALAANLYAQFERRQARSPEQREKVVKRASRMSRRKSHPKTTSENRTQFRATKLKIHPVRGTMRKGMKVTGGPFGPINGKGGKIVIANRWPPKGSRKLRSRR